MARFANESSPYWRRPAHKPGLALLDPLLPRIGGIERLEQDPDLRDRPVIFISAYGRNEAIVRALGTSAADCIVKPLSPSELTARVRSACAGGPSPWS